MCHLLEGFRKTDPIRSRALAGRMFRMRTPRTRSRPSIYENSSIKAKRIRPIFAWASNFEQQQETAADRVADNCLQPDGNWAHFDGAKKKPPLQSPFAGAARELARRIRSPCEREG